MVSETFDRYIKLTGKQVPNSISTGMLTPTVSFRDLDRR
jgi:hypothetical protein